MVQSDLVDSDSGGKVTFYKLRFTSPSTLHVRDHPRGHRRTDTSPSYQERPDTSGDGVVHYGLKKGLLFEN